MLNAIQNTLSNRKFMIALSSVLLVISITAMWFIEATWWSILYSILAGVFGGLLLSYIFPKKEEDK